MAEFLVAMLEVYATFGLLFAVAFVTRGVERVDPSAHGSTLGFRILILPGAAALWPLLLTRWIRSARGGKS